MYQWRVVCEASMRKAGEARRSDEASKMLGNGHDEKSLSIQTERV